jgi:hypothetical protein
MSGTGSTHGGDDDWAHNLSENLKARDVSGMIG